MSSTDFVSQKAKLLDDAPLCALVLGANGHVSLVNKVFIELMGPQYKFADYPFSQAPADDEGKTLLAETIEKVRSGKSLRERLRNLQMITLAGEAGLPVKAHFDWFIGPSDVAGEVIMYGDPCSDDILAQRHKDAELVDFFQNAPIALHWLSGTGHVLWANQTELDVLGYTAEEYIGQPIMKFCPDEEELVLEIFKTLGSGNIIKDVPVRFRTKDGKVLAREPTRRPLIRPFGLRTTLLSVVARPVPRCPLRVQIVPLLIDSNVAYTTDDQGCQAFGHTRCFIRDDTGRRVREARADAMLHETRRSLKLLDAFISRTLHLIKTPCHIVQQSLGLLASNFDKEGASGLAKTNPGFVAETDALLDTSITQLEDVTSLISDASDVIRFEQGAALQTVSVSVPLKVLGKGVVDFARTLAKPNVRIGVECAAGPAVVSLDAKVLHRALNHLLRNAVEATSAKGGTVTLRISHEPPSTEAGAEGAPAHRVRFEVHDTGCGLPKSTKGSNIFQRYAPGSSPTGSPTQTAGEVEKGVQDARAALETKMSFSAPKTTGLGIGLNLSYGLVRALGGELCFESEPGDTRFWCVLPVEGAHTPEPASIYIAEAPSPAGSREAINTSALKEWDRAERKQPRPSKRSGANWSSIEGTCAGTGTKRGAATASLGSPESSESGSFNKGGSFSKDSPGSSNVMTLIAESRFDEAVPCTKQVEASEIAGNGLKALDPPHVLIVEDTDMCAMVLEMLLSNLGCSSEVCEDGQLAVEKLTTSEPGLFSLILMDLRMPNMDGFEATEIIKSKLKLTVPVIALTADDTQESRERCTKIGFDDFVGKPLSNDVLMGLLEKHTGHCVAEK